MTSFPFSSNNPAESTAPLAGIRVLDMSSVIMGPFAAQILAEYGADVIKVESPEGDSTRIIGPMRNPRMGAMFLNANRNKRSIALDLKQPRGLAACLKLVEQADVLIANMRAPALERLGLGYERLAALNPGLVYVSLQGYGDSGPYADQPAYEDLIQGISAIPSLVSTVTGGAPRFAPMNICDRTTALYAVNAVLAALFERSRSGRGQRISLSMFETVTHLLLGDHFAGRTFEPPLGPAGYERILSSDRRPYATQDGYICVLLYTEKHWRAFLTLRDDRPALERDKRFRDVASRRKHFSELHRIIEKMMVTRTSAQWLKTLQQLDIPATHVHTLDDLIDDAHHTANGFFRTVEHASEGALRVTGIPGNWSRSSLAPYGDAPRLGEHTAEILGAAGYNAEQIAEMFTSGAALAPQSNVPAEKT